MATPLEWLAMAGWPSIDDLAGFSGVHRSTISRRVPEWLESGIVGVRDDGRLLRPRVRLLLGTGGLDDVFPQHHTHPGPDGSHIHDPLDPGSEDHTHPQFFNGYAGAALLYSRLEMMEIVYPLAPYALMGEGASWTHDGRARQLISWRWLRHTRLINAVATYEDGYRLFYCWIGQSVTVPMLEWRYKHRFDRHRLVTKSGADGLESWTDWLIDPPDRDLDLDPQPSGWVIVTPDYRGAELAADVLPVHGYVRPNAFLFAVGREGGPRVYTGQAHPAPHDDVADRFADVDVGIPQDLCR